MSQKDIKKADQGISVMFAGRLFITPDLGTALFFLTKLAPELSSRCALRSRLCHNRPTVETPTFENWRVGVCVCVCQDQQLPTCVVVLLIFLSTRLDVYQLQKAHSQ